jgi:hypothetical protein
VRRKTLKRSLVYNFMKDPQGTLEDNTKAIELKTSFPEATATEDWLVLT